MANLAEMTERLSEPFPEEALVIDPSRGQALVGIKGGWVIERLNDAFGLCGWGWRYSAGAFSNPEGSKKMRAVVLLQYRYPEGGELLGTGQYYVSQDGSLEMANPEKPHGPWSEPIVSYGDAQIIGDRKVDAMKGATTNGLSKAASMVGAGKEAYKGMLTVEDGEIIAKDGMSPSKKGLLLAVARMRRHDPEGLENLRAADNAVAGIVKESLFDDLSSYIHNTELGPFISANATSIIGRECKFKDMTIPEFNRMSDVVYSIAGGDVDMELAASVLSDGKWEAGTSWSEHVEASTKELPIEEGVIEVEDE